MIAIQDSTSFPQKYTKKKNTLSKNLLGLLKYLKLIFQSYIPTSWAALRGVEANTTQKCLGAESRSLRAGQWEGRAGMLRNQEKLRGDSSQRCLLCDNYYQMGG